MTTGVTLKEALDDLQADIIQGRKKLTDWDSGVKTWRDKGGDTIRAEYEKSYAEANG